MISHALSLPNGMFGYIYMCPLRVSDAGLLYTKNLDTYLSTSFREYNMNLKSALNQFLTLYGDGICLQLSAIVARFLSVLYDKLLIYMCMIYVRYSIEHLFVYHKNTFNLFSYLDRFCLLLSGVEYSQLMFNYFFSLSCFTCLNKIPSSFICPPSLEEYILLHDSIKHPPNIGDALLAEVYNYSIYMLFANSYNKCNN